MEKTRELFDIKEASILTLPEVDAAEKEFNELLNQVRQLDLELARKLDRAAGTLARAYELMGFIGAEDGKEATA